MRRSPSSRRESGQALLSVLALFVILNVFAMAFVWLMNAEQRRVGQTYREMAALYLAEAGVEKTVWLLSQAAGGGPGRGAPTEGYEEPLGSGRFTVEHMSEEGATLTLAVRGEAGGVIRRVRLTARIAPAALGFAVLAGDVVALTRQARTYVVPCAGPKAACRGLGDVAVSSDLLIDRDAMLNAFDGRRLALREGSVPDYSVFGLSSAWADPRLAEVLPDLAVIGRDYLTVGTGGQPLYDTGALRRDYPGIHVRSLRSAEASVPGVDLERYRALAEANHGNQTLNQAAGDRVFDRSLRDKKDSHYTPDQFETLLAYMDTRRRQDRETLALRGIVFVEGIVGVSRALSIQDGALVVRGTIIVMEHARLEVRHGPAASGLPGLIAFGDGGMIRLDAGSVTAVDGLVLASVGLEVRRASLEVSGAVATGQGFVNDGGLVVVRYSPRVLGTGGLARTVHVLIRPLAWQLIP
jgi:hypothetical protein